MGTHISFIRSVSLDRWKPEEIALIQSMGNAAAALIWEAKLPAGFRRPSPNDSMSLEKFIRDKYEHKRYYKPPPTANPPVKSETEIAGKIAGSGVLQPPPRTVNSANPGTRLGVNTPPRTNLSSSVPPKPTPTPTQTTLELDPFLAVKPLPTTSTPLPQPFSQIPETSPSATLFSSDFTVPQSAQNIEPSADYVNNVDVNLLKKSNIMSMFDVQTEQQKQQQMLLQQMYFSSPQMYYSTSGGLIPVMYNPQSYGPTNVGYPQHFQ
jgi:hypothetical protein